jgi:hypothetical protein
MTVIPCSSDAFSYALARAVNKVDYGGDLIRNVDAVWRLAARNGLAEKWGVDKVQRHMAAGFKTVRRRR